MKAINLKLKGLNSYIEEAEIDFESLCSKGLFGIFGPTGCGKSTILDAITIALYGATGMARDTKDFINTETQKAVIKYKFSLKNNDGIRIYDISRSFKNSKTGVNNHMAKLLVSDESGELIEVLDKAKDVNSYLEDLLGLTAADFMRSVVLPQGKFSEFLKLKDADRRRMIERLLNLQEFGVKLADKIKKQKEAIKSKIENLDGNINALSMDDDESIEDLDKELEILSQRLEKTNKEYKKFSEELDRVKEVYKKTDSLNDLLIRLSSFDEKLSYIENLKKLLLKANEASQISPIYLELVDEKKFIEEIKTKFNITEKKFIESDEENKLLLKEYEEHLKEKEEKLPGLVAFQAKVSEMARLADENDANIKSRDQLRDRYKVLKEDHDGLEKSYLHMDKYLEDTSKEIMELEKLQTKTYIDPDYKTMAIELRSKESLKKSENDKLKKLINSQLEYEKEKEKSIKENIDINETIEELRKKIEASKLEYEKASNEFETIRIELHESDKKLMELKSHNINYKNELTKKEEFLDLQARLLSEKKELEKSLNSKEKESKIIECELINLNEKEEENRVNLLLNELASKIEDGSSCPLCGSQSHPHIHKKIDKQKTYEPEIDSIKSSHEKLKASIMGLIKDLEFNQSRLKDIDAQILKLKDYNEKIYKEKLVEEEKKEKRLEHLNKNLKEIEESKLKNKNDFEAAQNHLEKNREIQSNLSNKLESNIIKLSEAQKNIDICKDTIKELNIFTEEKLSNTSFKLVIDLLEELSIKESLLLETEKKLKNNREILSANQKKIKEIQIKKDDTYKSMTSIEEKGSSLSDSIKLNNKKISEVSKGDPRRELSSLTEEIKRINDSYQKTKEKYELSNKIYMKLEKERDELSTKVDISIARIRKLDDKFNGLLENSSFINVVDFENSIMDQRQISEKTNEVKSFEEEYTLLKSKLSTLKEELKDQTCSKEKYDEYIEENEKYKKLIADLSEDHTVKKTKLEQLKKNARALKEILKDKKLLINRQGIINEISRLTNGNKFVEFVATNHLRYIAADASTRLMDITNGRYSLELDYSGGFLICDNYNGGVKRSCQSLSGGETFMTSLSLALALSTHIQLKGAATLEFFILDEGFGTLDVDLLDTVMNSLEKLRSKNISVGVISHVEELKNRVPMRLSVSGAEPGLHGTKVKIESN